MRFVESARNVCNAARKGYKESERARFGRPPFTLENIIIPSTFQGYMRKAEVANKKKESIQATWNKKSRPRVIKRD